MGLFEKSSFFMLRKLIITRPFVPQGNNQNETEEPCFVGEQKTELCVPERRGISTRCKCLCHFKYTFDILIFHAFKMTFRAFSVANLTARTAI